jgi:hypothetical protein
MGGRILRGMTQPGPDPRYEVARKGNPVGIHTLGEIAGLIAAGTLLWSDDCWTEGMESWGKLSDLKEQIEAAAPPEAPPEESSNGPLYIGITVTTLLVAGLVAFFALSGESDGSDSSAPATATTAPRTLTERQKALRISLSETQQQIAELVATSFVETKDESSGRISYVHRYYLNIGNRIPLRVYVDSTGQRHLYTYYLGKSWIFHNQLRFEFSRQTVETQVIPAFKALRDIGENNLLTESCRFIGDEDEKIVRKLALASATPIKMQMLGRKPAEKPLSYETKEAIKESHALAELLAKRHRLLEDVPSAL